METLTAIPTTLSTIMSGSESNDNVPTTTAFNKMGFGNPIATPFIPNLSCFSSWEWYDINSSAPTPASAASSTILLKPYGVRASCMPDPEFWDETFDFMPGVCPQDWIMYDIGRATVPRKEDSVIRTTAYCCPQGYTVTDGAVLGMAQPTERACFANFPTDGPVANITVTKMPNRANSGPSSRTFEFGDVIQPAWHIIWDSTDQAGLRPSPPTLRPEVGDMIATWTPPYVTPAPTALGSTTTRPGMLSSLNIGTSTNASTHTPTYAPEVTGSRYNPNCYSSSLCSLTPGIMFAIVGVPVIVSLLFLWCCIYCWRQNRKAKRDAAQRRLEAADRAVGGEPELVVVQPGVVRDVHTGLEGAKKTRDGELELPLYTKAAHEVTEAPPAYTPPAKEVKE